MVSLMLEGGALERVEGSEVGMVDLIPILSLSLSLDCDELAEPHLAGMI